MQVIDGKVTAKAIKAEIRIEVDAMILAGNRPPHLAAILVGHDGGSETYVAYKIKDCEEVFVEILINPCSTPDNLFVLGHRLNSAFQYDYLASLSINTGCHQF